MWTRHEDEWTRRKMFVGLEGALGASEKKMFMGHFPTRSFIPSSLMQLFVDSFLDSSPLEYHVH